MVVVGRQQDAAGLPVGFGLLDALAARRHKIPPDEALAQRLHVDFRTDARFDNPRAAQIRLRNFDLQGLEELGRRVRDLAAAGKLLVPVLHHLFHAAVVLLLYQLVTATPDDGAAALQAHPGKHSLRHRHRPKSVDREQRSRRVHGDTFERAEKAGAGIVHEHIDRPGVLDGL